MSSAILPDRYRFPVTLNIVNNTATSNSIVSTIVSTIVIPNCKEYGVNMWPKNDSIFVRLIPKDNNNEYCEFTVCYKADRSYLVSGVFQYVNVGGIRKMQPLRILI